MNSQIKFLLFLVFIVGLFMFLQDRFKFLNISITPNGKNVQEEHEPKQESEKGSQQTHFVEISTREESVIKVNVDIADDVQKRALGLSHRKYLGSYDGMWFIFDQDTEGGFWMKDMLIPLDIIFVDASGFIVDIKADQQPCKEDFCPTITPASKYRYVLEVNSNFCKENAVVVGDSIKLNTDVLDNV